MPFWNRIFGGKPGPNDPETLPEAALQIDYATLVDRAVEELRFKTQTGVNLYQLDQASWDADLDAGTITFTSPRGLVATAPVQVVGTVNSLDSTWLWSWANASVPEHVTRHARLVQQYGLKHGIGELTDRKLVVQDETECWRFAALACYLGQDQGAYRGPSDDVRVFVTYGTVTLQSA
jgi:Family of unknown function (DUF6882)